MTKQMSDTFGYFCTVHKCDRRTDEQTDDQTDGIIIRCIASRCKNCSGRFTGRACVEMMSVWNLVVRRRRVPRRDTCDLGAHLPRPSTAALPACLELTATYARHHDSQNIAIYRFFFCKHTDGSIVFARWRQCTLPWGNVGATWRIRLILCLLRPTRVHNLNGISIGSAVFAQLTAERPYTLQWVAFCPSKLRLGEICTPSHTILWAHTSP